MSEKRSALTRWLGSRKPQRARPPERPAEKPRLKLEALEARETPATQLFAGLEFATTGTFDTSNNAVTSSGPVQVGVAPAPGDSFTPLLLLQNGVQFTTTDATGTFTTGGAVSAYAGGTLVPLLDAHAHTFEAPGLLGSGYETLSANDTNAADLPVAGGDLAVTGLHFAGTELDVQGNLSLPAFSGLQLAVGGADHVALSASGAQLSGLTESLSGTSFTEAGLTFTTNGVQVQYDAANNAFDLSGTASLAAGGNTLSLTLGDAAAPGLVIENGQLQSLDASVTSDFQIGGLTIQADGLTVQATASSTVAITGNASVNLDVAGQSEKVALQLGQGGQPGIVIDQGSGKLVSLDAVVNSDISIAGVDLRATDLGAHYSSATGLFSITGGASLSLTVDGQSENIGVTLGGSDADGNPEPGIAVNLNNGQLTALDAVINADLSIDGADVAITGLGVHYRSDAGTFEIFGGASVSFDVGGSTESLSVTLGNQQTPGIVFDAGTGTLSKFNGSLSGHLAVAGLTVSADSLSVQYDAAASDLVVSGGASFAFAGNTVQLQLGGSYSAGLVIVGGALQSLEASVTTDLDLLGLKIKADGLTVAYVAPGAGTPEELALFGKQISIESGFINFTTKLGDASNPGILIADGQLKNLNIAVSGGFSLFGIQVAADGLAIRYASDANQLELAGGFMLDFTDAFQVSAAITKGALFIDTRTGALSIPSGGLEIQGSAQLGPFAIQNLKIAFGNGPNGVNFSASGTVDLPGGFSVSLDALDIVNGQLADIGVSENIPIEIGDTGFVLDSLSGSLKNLNNPSQLVVTASAEVSLGDKIHIPSLGPIFAGGDFYLVDATGTITISANELALSGNVSLLGGLLGQGNASLDLNWAKGVYTASGDFSMFDHIIDFKGSLAITNQGAITLQATASVNVPPQIPFIGGDSLGNINFYLQYRPHQALDQDFVAAWTSVNLFVTSFTIGFEIDFNGKVSVINGDDVAAIEAAAATSSQPSQYVYSQTFAAPIQPTPDSLAPSYQITASSAAFDGFYLESSYVNDYQSAPFVELSGHIFSDYQLSHPYAIRSTLSFGVYVDTDVTPGGIYAGIASFDANGNFHFTPSGNTSLVPTGGTLYSDGRILLQWPYAPYGSYTSAISASYNTDSAHFELLQKTTSGSYYPLQTYSLDPVSTDSGDPVQTAMTAELLVTDNGLVGTTFSTGQAPQTSYKLTHGAADPKTVSFALYQGSTLLGNGSFDANGNFHFTPNGTPSIVPSGGRITTNLVGDGLLILNWQQLPPPTAINITYASIGNRVIDYRLDNSESTPNGVPGQYEIELVSSSALTQPIDFAATPLYQPPSVSFASPFPSVNPSTGALTVNLVADVWTPSSQWAGSKNPTVSLYYDTTGDPANGTLIDTFNYSDFASTHSLNYTWGGFANLPAGNYYLYAVVNDGVNPPQVSTDPLTGLPVVRGPFAETSPTPALSGPKFLALAPGSGGAEQGVFSAANGTALGVATNFAYPVTVDLKVTGGTLIPAGGTPTTELKQTYATAAAAVQALDGLTFVSGTTFTGAANLTFTVTTNVNGVAYKAVDTIPLLTPNTHLIVSQSVDSTLPADPSQHTLTVTVTNPGGPDGQDGTAVQVQNSLSSGLAVLSSSASQGSYDPARGLWSIGDLPVGGTVTLTLTLQADPDTQGMLLTNSARATATPFAYPGSDAQSVVPIRRPQPITITVTNLNDSGAGSLRAALAGAENGDTIQFSPALAGGTLNLASGELLINQDLTLLGPAVGNGAPGIAISGNNLSRVFDIEGGAKGVDVTLENLTIENGLAGVGGGILVNDAGSSLTLSNLLLSGNAARAGSGGSGQGGGIAFLGGIATFSDSAFVNNQATGGLGGGLYVSGGNLTLLNDTIANNQATGGQGGGVYVGGGAVTLGDDTLAGNTAATGGNVYQATPGFVEARNSIFANPGATFTGPDFFGTVGFSDHNLIDNTAGSSGFSAASGDLLNVSANLAPLGNYGGPTPTMPLLPGSPAINAGDGGVLTPQTIPGLVSYWRGENNGLDTAGNNNGTLTGGVSFAPGAAGSAFQLDGSTGYLQTAPNPASLSINDALSVSALVNPSVYKLDNVIIDKTQTGDAANYRFGIHNDGRLFFYNGSQAVFSNAVIPLNTFTQVGFTLAANGALSFYANGQLDSTRVIGFGALNTAPVLVGRDLPGRYFQGLLDEVTVYHAILTPAQMSLLAAPSAAPAETGPTTVPGLVSLFGGEGNAQDATGNNYAKASASVTYGPGVVGQAFQLNGVDGQVNVADNPSLNPAAFTVGGWFNVAQAPAAGSEYFLASKYGGDYHGWILRLSSNLVPTLSLLSSPNGNVNAVSSQALSPNTWYYLSATFDGTNGTLFVNGTPVASVSLPGGYAPSATPLVIGSASWFGGGHFNGSIDEFSFFDRVLTPAELRSLAVTGSVGADLATVAGLTNLYHAQGNAADSAGSSTGTLAGGVGYAPGVVGQAFSLNGQGSFVDLGTGPDVVGTGPFSVAAWVKTTATGGVIVNQRDPSNYNGEYFLSLAGGKVAWSTFGNNQSGFAFTSKQSVNDGAWHLIVATRLGDGTGQIFIDGVLDNQQAAPPVPLGGGFHVYLGEDVRNAVDVGPSYANNFVGQIDEVQIYNRALTPAQIGVLLTNPGTQALVTGDQRGDLRTVGGTLDIGAAEYQYDLAVGGTAPTSVTAGGTLTYTLTVTNNGPDSVSGVTLTDVLPAGVGYLSATAPAGWTVSGPAAGQTGTVTFTYAGSLASGATATFTLNTQAPATGTAGQVLTNTATVGPTGFDTLTGSNGTAFRTTWSAGQPAGVDIHGQPADTMVGQPIPPVTVAVVDQYGNTVTDSDQLVTLAIASGPAGATLGGTTTVRAVNGVATFTGLTLNVAGTYTLKATGGTLDPDLSNSFTVSPVDVTADLRIRPGRVIPGDGRGRDRHGNEVFSQTITVINTSDHALQGPLGLVLGNLPKGIALLNASGTYEGSPYVNAIPVGGTLEPGQRVTITLEFSVTGHRGRDWGDEFLDFEALLGV